MKKFLKYSIVAVLTALLTMLALGWSFWATLVLAELGYLWLVFRNSQPKLSKWLGIGLGAYAVFLTAGYWFSGAFPLTKGVLSRSILRRDAQAALRANDGLGPASAVIVNNLVREGDKLAARINNDIASGSPQGVTNTLKALEEFQVRWDIIKSGLKPAAPPPAFVPVTNTPPPVSTFIVNQGEIVSTLSLPDNSTVHFEADKAFGILERYGATDAELSKVTIPPGKSQRYFGWGGTLRVVGMHTNTTVKLHL